MAKAGDEDLALPAAVEGEHCLSLSRDVLP